MTIPPRSAALALMAFLAGFCACGPPPRSNDIAELDFGPIPSWTPPPHAPSPEALFCDESGLILLLRGGPRVMVVESRDDGRSWSEKLRLDEPLLAYDYDPFRHDFHVVRIRGRVLLHSVQQAERGQSHQKAEATYRPDVITDDCEDSPLYPNLRCLGPDRLALVWADPSSGLRRVLFSGSSDHGQTWTVPATVNREILAAEALRPSAFFSGGAWYMTWSEDRGQNTLFDVYASRSVDGISWSIPRAVNDDGDYAWNLNSWLAGDDKRVFIGFSDFRDFNRFRDRDQNVYLAALDPEGAPISTNRRINDVTDGSQDELRLLYDSSQNLLYAAWLDERRQLGGDLYASFSRDQGRTWTASQRVNQGDKGPWLSSPFLVRSQGGGCYVGWVESSRGIRTFCVRKVLGLRIPRAASEDRPVTIEGPVIREEATEPSGVFHSSFDFPTDLSAWRPVSGQWILQQGYLLGFDVKPCLVRWHGPDAADLVLEGRFRLDPLMPTAASLVFRVQPSESSEPLEGYMLLNEFRRGVWLLQSEGGFSAWRRKTTILADAAFPFQAADWHSFRLVIAGNKLDYYVDRKWVLSTDQLHAYKKGGLLLGGTGQPIRFDDIRISELAAK